MSLFLYEDPNSGNDGKSKPRVAIKVDMIPDRAEGDDPSNPNRRINYKALVILGILVPVMVVLFFVLASVQDVRLRHLALEQASEAAEKGNIDQALLSLEHYLYNWPDDVPGLELAARLRTENARNLEEIIHAADAQDHLLRVDPQGPDRQSNRRKLIELYVRWSEGVRRVSATRKISVDKTENRSRAAVKIAEQMISFGADDGETHRLLAMALESLAAAGDSNALAQSTLEYEKALRRDPGDVAAAERLAKILYERSNETTGSDEVLDELIQANPKSVEARMARHRFFNRTSRFDQARLELETMTKLAPTDLRVRLAATIEAIQRRDTASARHHLEAIGPVPASSKESRRIAMLWGFVRLAEQHPDYAIDAWRKGLQDSAGSDRELTWRLAYTLLQIGRFAEAIPLVDQFRRLAGDDDGMYLFLRGAQAEAMGRPSAAIADLENLRGSVDKIWHSDLAMTLGRAFEKINDDNRAMMEYRLAIQGSPRSVGAWRSLIKLVRKTSFEKARTEVEAALVQLPDDPFLLLDFVSLLLEEQLARLPADRNWSKVNEVLDRAQKVPNPSPDLIKIRAEVLLTSGKAVEALEALEKAVTGPGRSRDDLWLSWANGLASTGKPDEALKVLERGSAPDQAGDHASLRIARANLKLQAGQGRAARDLISRGVETLPLAEQIDLAKARSRILQVLGDKAGARDACMEWARLAPLDPQAGLALLEMSQRVGDEEAAKLGLEVLRKVGGENEPYALAARALDLLRSNRKADETRTARLEKADELSQKLMTKAPKLPVSRLVRGMVMERNHRLEEAIIDYQVALDGNTAEMALARLTQLYTRLKRFKDLAALKSRLSPSIAIDQIAAKLAIEQGDKDGAEKLVSGLIEGQSDNTSLHVAQARLLRELGKPQAAEEALRVMVDRAKDRPDSWVNLVMFQVSQGASAEALKTIDRAKDEYQGDRPDLLMARLRWIIGDRDAASKLYDEAIKTHRDDLLTYQAASAFAEASGRPERAEALARRALTVPSCSAWAARTLAILLSKRSDPASWKEAWSMVAPGGPGSGDSPGDRLLRASLLALSPEPARREEALAVLTALAEDLPISNPVAIRARITLATLLAQAGKAAEAAGFIAPATEESVAVDPPTLALAIEILANAGRADEADQRLSRLAAAASDSFQATVGRARIFKARGKLEEAIATIEDAALADEKAPDGPARHLAYVNLLISMNQGDAAERMARKIAKLWPKDACILAEILAGRGRFTESLDAIRIAADAGATLEPMRAALRLVINARLDPSQAEKARAIAETVTAAQPNDVGLMLMAVSLANRQKRFDDALKLCRRAFEVNPSNPLCFNSLNDMAWIFCEDLNRPAEALVEVERVLKVEATGSAMDTRGVILTRLGKFDEAADQLERCVKKEPTSSRFLHLARAYQKAGKLEQYQGALDRARKAGIKVEALSPKEREEFAAVLGK